jgi:hypothetical protein
MGRTYWLTAMVLVVLAIGLPFLGTLARRRQLPHCALDGVAIVPVYAVTITTAGGPRRTFCCIRCAEYWLAREPAESATIGVTDEVSGRPVDASRAYFVRSSVVTNPVTGNQSHAFADLADAELHASQFRGRVLDEDERPFRGHP